MEISKSVESDANESPVKEPKQKTRKNIVESSSSEGDIKESSAKSKSKSAKRQKQSPAPSPPVVLIPGKKQAVQVHKEASDKEAIDVESNDIMPSSPEIQTQAHEEPTTSQPSPQKTLSPKKSKTHSIKSQESEKEDDEVISKMSPPKSEKSDKDADTESKIASPEPKSKQNATEKMSSKNSFFTPASLKKKEDVAIVKAPAANKSFFTSTSKQTSSSKDSNDIIPYLLLCETFAKIEETTKRLQIQTILTTFFSHVIETSPKNLIECVYLCLNRIGPEYEGKELGLGESLLIKAIANATGRTAKSVKTEVQEKGDLGLVAQASRGNQRTMVKPKSLSTHSVFESLKAISNMSGNSCQSRKIETINKMLISCTENEPKYLMRSLEGKLRIGLAQQTVLIALSHAIALMDES